MKHFKCVHCKETWDLEDSQVGQVIECPKCHHKFRIHTKRRTTLEMESESETKVSFKRAKPEEPEMDLTPMVDVTFQLLIFFMVTASYSIQKALEVPAAQEMAEAAQNIVQTDEDDGAIVVKIERDNTIWVESVEAPSYQDLISKLKERKNGANSLKIEADNDCDYEYVVRAVDAGSAAGMNKVQLTMTSSDD